MTDGASSTERALAGQAKALEALLRTMRGSAARLSELDRAVKAERARVMRQRDEAICKAAATGQLSMKQLATAALLSTVRVKQIVVENKWA